MKVHYLIYLSYWLNDNVWLRVLWPIRSHSFYVYVLGGNCNYTAWYDYRKTLTADFIYVNKAHLLFRYYVLSVFLMMLINLFSHSWTPVNTTSYLWCVFLELWIHSNLLITTSFLPGYIAFGTLQLFSSNVTVCRHYFFSEALGFIHQIPFPVP